jgi:integrase
MSRRRGTGHIYQQRGCKTWSIKFYQNGRCIRESTNTDDYQAARQKLNIRLGQVGKGEIVRPHLERTTVRDLAKDFLRDYRVNGKRSIGHAETRWRLHLEPFFGSTCAALVDSDTINMYVDTRMEQGAKPATINNELAALKRMFRLGYGATPAKVMRLPRFPKLEVNNTRTGFLEPEQFAKLTGAVSELWLRTFLELAYTYGWRKHELLSLRVNQIDLRQRTIRLDPGTTKNRDGRQVAMSQTVYTLLSQCVARKSADDFVLARADRKPVRDFRQAWRKLCVKVGLAHVTCSKCSAAVSGKKCLKCGSHHLNYQGPLIHDFRRTMARNYRRSGVQEHVIMRIGGWRTRHMFTRYDIVSTTDVSEAVAQLEKSQAQAAAKPVPDFLGHGHDFGHDRTPKAPTTTAARLN